MMSDRQSNSDEPTNGGITPTENREAGSSASDENRLSVQQSFFYRWRIRITAVVLVGAWFGVLFSAPLIRSGSLAAVLADYFGWLLFNSGVVLRIWAITNIGGRKSQVIVNHGPYAFCRNPLYVGTFLLILSEAFFLKSTTFVVVAIGLFIMYHCCVVSAEERVLLSRFGLAFSDYCDAVPRWWPRRGAPVSLPVVISSNPLIAELRQTGWWLALPLLGTMTAYLQNHPDWPHFFRLQ